MRYKSCCLFVRAGVNHNDGYNDDDDDDDAVAGDGIDAPFAVYNCSIGLKENFTIHSSKV